MKISVVTPSFNQGRFIQRCIDSVKLQQGVDVEHIILDNCSTDETSEVLRAYQKNSQRVDVKIIIEPDRGQTDAINRGFRMATGDVVCWLNTDELYYPETLYRVADFFTQNSQIDVVFGDCDFVDARGTIVKRKKEFGFNRKMLLYYGCYIPSCATFIRRRVIESGYLLDESFRVCMDFEYYARLSTYGYNFAHIPMTLAKFTWHDTNISSVLVDRRREERHRVQLKCGGFNWLSRMRLAWFDVLKWYWIGWRSFNRVCRGRRLLRGSK